jgi:hypothetical protein
MGKLIIIFSLITNILMSQNLVPNSEFEILTSMCPDPIGNINNALTNWFEFGSADNFNSCDTTNYFGVPVNIVGYQNAYSGNDYAGMVCYYSTIMDREYLEVKLSSPLLNQIYYVQFYVSLADSVQYAIENLGALFTDKLFNPFPPPSYAWVSGVPQVENISGNMLNDKQNWSLISGSFVANGGEQYITIGNFKNDAQTVKQYFGGTAAGTLGAYYFIDNVYVGTTPPIGIPELQTEHVIKLYPNPSSGNIILECNMFEQSAELIIYSLTGEPMIKYFIPPGTKTMNINAESLQAGMYLYELNVNGKPQQKNKLTIIK